MWYYNDKEFLEEDIKDYVGFVYNITNLTNGKRYIGKKLFNFSKILYRKAKNKRLTVRSDYMTYYGSNDELNADVKLLGEENFRRDILRLCKSKSECNYAELSYQVKLDVLLYPELFYNAYVGTKINRKQLGALCQKVQV